MAMEYTRTMPANYRLSLFYRKRIHDKIDRIYLGWWGRMGIFVLK